MAISRATSAVVALEVVWSGAVTVVTFLSYGLLVLQRTHESSHLVRRSWAGSHEVAGREPQPPVAGRRGDPGDPPTAARAGRPAPPPGNGWRHPAGPSGPAPGARRFAGTPPSAGRSSRPAPRRRAATGSAGRAAPPLPRHRAGAAANRGPTGGWRGR